MAISERVRAANPGPNQKQTATANRSVAASVNAGADSADRCRRCGRVLRTELAVAAQLGPVCAMAAIARKPLRSRDDRLDTQPELPLDIEAVA